MCWFVQHFWNIQTPLDMSRRKQANPAKLDPQEEDLQSQHIPLAEDETGASSGSAASAETGQGFDDIHSSEEPSQDHEDAKPGPYKCTVCGENFLKEKLLREHEQSHTDHLQFTCSYCPRLFKHKRSRDRHTKLHTGDKKYKCQQCESAFSRSDHLKIHMKTHDSRKPYKCGTCNRGYNTAAALSSHQQSHLKQESRSGSRTSGGSTPSPGLFRCNHCTETFGKPDLLQSHVTMVHSDTDSSFSQTPEPLADYQNQIDDLKIVCMYCSKEFPSLDLMYQHSNIAHRDVSNGISSSSNLTSPIVQHSPKSAEICQNGTPPSTYSCDRCTMQLDSVQNLKNHINNVHWRPAIASPAPINNSLTASKIFSPFQTQPTDLSRKNKNKTKDDSSLVKKKKQEHSPPPVSPYDSNDKPCICSCCYAQLPNFKSFLHHMETHMVSSNNSLLGFCPVCGEPGRDPVSFTNHIFSHAIAQVPGRCCYTCKKSFERLEELQKHLLEAHVVQVFKCTICNDVFDTKISMQLHLTNKHSDECKHFKCYLCNNQVFHDRLSAELHISMKHYQQFTPCITTTNQSLLRSPYQTELDARLREYSLIFQCTFCHKSFKDQYSQYLHILKEHNETKEGDKFVLDSTPSRSPNFMFSKILTPDQTMEASTESQLKTCDMCNRADIATEVDLATHKKLHHSKNKISPVSLQCAYCNEYCKSRSDLENHMKTHQVTCGKGKHKCNICDEIYSSTLTLADHKLTHCKIVEGNCCVQCKSVLTDEQCFYTHQLQHSSSPAKNNAQIALPANCIICCQTLQTDVEIKLHAKFHLKHLQQKESLCGVCNKIFDGHGGQVLNNFDKSSEALNIFLCKDCSSVSKNNGTHQSLSSNCESALKILGNSISANNGNKKFACIQCPLTFDSESDVQSHAAMHMLNEGTNLECRLCKQVFSSPLKLQTHLIEHNFYGMNQYSCYVCSSVFTAASGLQNHIIGHGLDSRPYECSQCQMKFFFRAELDNHKFAHIRPQKFNGVDIYDQTNNTQYKICKYCSNSYLDNSFFLEHLSQCPFKMKVSPKRENFDNSTSTDMVIDNNCIKQEITDEVTTKTEVDDDDNNHDQDDNKEEQ